MAKRLTDNTKWEDPWFADLPSKYKLFWIYLLDKCDHAGIWKVNFKHCNYFIGEHLETSEVKRIMSERVEFLSDNYWYVIGFCNFQYGEELPKNKVGDSIAKLHEKHNIQRVSKGLGNGSVTVLDKDKDKDKDKDTYKEPSEVYDDWKNDSLYIEELQRLFLSWNIKATEQTVAKAIKKFLLIEFKPGVDRYDLKLHFKRWINRNTKDFA